MRNIILKVFAAFGFHAEEAEEQIMFFQKAGSDRIEYYLVLFVKKENLKTGIDDQLEAVYQLFQIKKKLAQEIDKNTSLIICVEFDNYQEDCLKYKNRMLQIEEDEYYYRKYLLPYTNLSLQDLQDDQEIVYALNAIVMNDASFQEFNNNIYQNETYFLAIQIFIKLPFLSFTINQNEKFQTISQILSRKIAVQEQLFLNEIIIPYELNTFQRDQLLNYVLDPLNNTFDQFLNTFLGDAPTS